MIETEGLENTIGYKFQDKRILLEALTHPSYLIKNKGKQQNYERLEFLGDSIVNFIIADTLFNKFPGEDEGQLARRKGSLVCGETMSLIALEIGLGKYMIMAEGEKNTGGLIRKNNLENTLEALVGAIYTDSNILHVTTFVRKYWDKLLINKFSLQQNSKTFLQEWAQKRGLSIPEYKVIEVSGKDHDPLFTIEVMVESNGSAISCGTNKKIAEKNAAKKMIQRLEKKEEE